MVRRFLQLLGALGAALLAGGWWLLLVQLTSPANRPFIGGSRHNSVIELTLGYNGLDRLTGVDASRTMSVDVTGPSDVLDVGFQRFLHPQFSGQSGWFLPLAVAGLCVGIWCLWRRQGPPAARPLILASCVWFVCAATVIAFMSGIVHSYYVLTAVPPLCFLAAMALVRFLRGRQRLRIRILFGLTLIASMIFAFVTVSRSADEFPWLPVFILLLWGLAIAVVLVRPPNTTVAKMTAPLVIVALFTGPLIWSGNTVLSPHSGAGVIAGPSILGARTDDSSRASPDIPASYLSVSYGDLPSRSLLERLRQSPSSETWAAAVVGSETAANYQLSLGRAVLPLGGFDGTDPFPTLEQFKVFVMEGRIGSVVIQGLPPLTVEGRGESARIVEWVRQRFVAEDIDGAQYFQLTK